MTPQQRELLRNHLLLALEASGPYSPTLPVLRVNLRVAGHPHVTDEEIAAELAYLRDKGMAAPETKAVSPENARWRITAAGRDHLATEDLT